MFSRQMLGLRAAIRAPIRAPIRARFCTAAAPGVGSELARRKRLIWHSKQRGWLELDLLMGGFAEKFLPSMTAKELDLWEDVLIRENPDLFKWLNNQLPVPEDLSSNEVMVKLLKYVNEEHVALKPGEEPQPLFK